jgi:hypothetical protein
LGGTEVFAGLTGRSWRFGRPAIEFAVGHS